MCGNFFTQTLNKKTNRGKSPFGCQAFENSFKDNIYLRTQTLKRNHIVVKCVESVSHKLCTETNTGKSHFSCPVCENCLRDNLYIKTDIPMRNHKVSDVVCSIVFGTRSVPLHLLWIGTGYVLFHKFQSGTRPFWLLLRFQQIKPKCPFCSIPSIKK